MVSWGDTEDIEIDSQWLKDLQKLESIFGDNFCFVLNDGYIKYILAIEKHAEHDYEMFGIDPVGETDRWQSYSDEHKKLVIRNSLRL
ncbi:MAG TPA: hypothetical protein VF884_13675 [Nitrososphaeraceae archaeon]